MGEKKVFTSYLTKLSVFSTLFYGNDRSIIFDETKGPACFGQQGRYKCYLYCNG